MVVLSALAGIALLATSNAHANVIRAATTDPSASASPTDSPTPTDLSTPLDTAVPVPPRTVATYDVTKPFFQQVSFPFTFDAHLYSYKTSSSLWVLVNKSRRLKPKAYAPKVVKPKFSNTKVSNPMGLKLRSDAAAALALMDKAMYSEIRQHIKLASGYRSYASQLAIHNSKVGQLGLIAGEKLAARAGYSEHQTGLAADLSTNKSKCYILVCFGKETGGKWLAANSWKYGFILRYPNRQTSVTGYQYEPWHFRFIGTTLAEEYHYSGAKTYEQFLGAGNAPTYGTKAVNQSYFY